MSRVSGGQLSSRRRAVPRRKVQRATRGWHPALPSVLALLACVGVLGAALGGVFKVRTVQVVGRNVPENRIVAAANVTGQNIFTVRSDQIVARLSAVREVVVTRVDTQFPDQVTIHAQIRPSLVAWQTPSGLYVLDTDGRIIKRVQHTSLPIIVGSDAHGALGSGVVQAVRYGVQALPGAPGGAVSTFRYDLTSGLTIVGRAGWTATVGTGSPDTLVRRIADLAALLQAIKGRPQHLQSVDLRYRTPYARFTPP